MNIQSSCVIGLFDKEPEARSTVRKLVDEGISAYSISSLNPTELRKPRPPRRLASFFVGSFFGAVGAGGLVLTARLYPEVNQFFQADWQTAGITGALLGAVGGAFIGLVLASVAVDETPPSTEMSIAQGTWPEGMLLAITCSNNQKASCEETMRRSGAVNLTVTSSPPSSAAKVVGLFGRRETDRSSERRLRPSDRRDRQPSLREG